MKESHCLQLRRVSTEHLLNGTVALDRMQKRFVAAQHHFRHPCAPRCGNDLVLALHRLPMSRFAFTRQDLLTRLGLARGTARLVACCIKEDRPVAVRLAFGHRPPPSRCVRWAAQGAHAEGCRDRERPLEAKPCLPKPAKATRWWPQCRFAAEEGVKRRDNTICATACYTPVCLRARPLRRLSGASPE